MARRDSAGRAVKAGRMQAKDIADAEALAAMQRVKDIRDDGPYPIRTLGVSRWDLAAVLAGHAEDVAKYDGTRDRWDYPEVPPKVLAVKLVSMIRRGLVDGCEDVRCNCRGDFNAVGG